MAHLISSKALKCYSCKSFVNELFPLAFDRHICAHCVEQKCELEYRPAAERTSPIDTLNSVAIVLSRIDFCAKSKQQQRTRQQNAANNIGMQLHHIRARLNSLRLDMSNHRAKIKSGLEPARLQVRAAHAAHAKGIARRVQQIYLNALEQHETETRVSYRQSRHEMKQLVSVFLEQNVAHLNRFRQRAEQRPPQIDPMDLDAYEVYLRLSLTRICLALCSNRFLSLSHVTGKGRTAAANAGFDLGRLRFVSDAAPRPRLFPQKSSSTAEKSSFSIDSILNMQTNESMSMQQESTEMRVFYRVKSMHTLVNRCTSQESVLFFYELSDESSGGINSSDISPALLKVYNECGELSKQLTFKQRVCALGTDNQANLVVCGQASPTSCFEMSLLNTNIELELNKRMYVISPSEHEPVDLCVENNRVFLLAYAARSRLFKIFILNFNFDLMNSIELDFFEAESAAELAAASVKAYAKCLVKNNLIFVKQMMKKSASSTTRMLVVDYIYGSLVKSFDLKFEFDFFAVVMEPPTDNTCDLACLKLIFLQIGKYFVYDMLNEKILFSARFHENEKFFNLFCLNGSGEIVSLMQWIFILFFCFKYFLSFFLYSFDSIK